MSLDQEQIQAKFGQSKLSRVLGLLSALQDTPLGNTVYQQLERLLLHADQQRRQVEQGYATLIRLLIVAFSQQFTPGTVEYTRCKVLEAQLQSPLELDDFEVLAELIKACTPNVSAFEEDQNQFMYAALQPLVQHFSGQDDGQSTWDARNATPNAMRPTAAAESMDLSNNSEFCRDALVVEAQAGVKDLKEVQDTLARRVLDTISHNQKFGVMLEVILHELQQADSSERIETLRQSLVSEIINLMEEHRSLADKLDSTHRFLGLVASDSRKLSDELNRVRLLSLTDDLTGLPNRRAFLRRLEDEVGRAQRYSSSLALAVLDLDRFKLINDEFGHTAGDDVLRSYAQQVLSVFRHHDLVARYGGEEFAVLLPNTDVVGARRALDKIREAARQVTWEFEHEQRAMPTFSAGLALYRSGETPGAFIERADASLYRAKRLGRDRVEADVGLGRSNDDESSMLDN